MSEIVDTNVVLIANRQHSEVSENCVSNCAVRLRELMNSGKIALDDRFLILIEYQHKTNPRQGKGPGDVFVKWALRNSANPNKCDLVHITDHPERGFAELPEDERLSNFDHSDRKFVAVSIAHPEHPKILQAADSKWLNWYKALKDHGVGVDFLCPTEIERFRENKS